jgi:peptide/nickel transport system substrate-binding protein
MMLLATWNGRCFAMYPAEYLKQYHADYNPNVEELVAANDQAEDWPALFLLKSAGTWCDPSVFYQQPELPSLGPWVVKQPLGAGTTVIMERNPYYFKVDTNGNQLPYIDTVLGMLYQDGESRTFAMLNGDLDFIKDAGDANRELYFDAVDAGKPIEIRLPNYDMGNMQSIHFNMTAKDPVKNEVFNSKDFRIGMSYAINRAEIIEVVFKGQGKPAQVCPMEDSPLYNEQLCNQYIEFDLDKANEYLDKVMPDKDGDGYRVGSDGKRFNPIFNVRNDDNEGQHWVQVAELLIEQWKKAGVEVLLNAVSGAVDDENRAANDIEIYMFHGGEGGSGMTAIIDPRWHVPGEFWGIFGMGWYRWIYVAEDDEFAVEPPDLVMDIRALYKTATQQPTREGQIKYMQEIMQLSADNLWTLGITRPGTTIQPISARLGNIPEKYLKSWTWGFDKILRPEQWYIK